MSTLLAKLIGQQSWGMLYRMTDEQISELAAAAAHRAQTKAADDAAQARVIAAVIAAAKAQVPQVQIVRVTGLSREYIRKLVRASEGANRPETS